MNAGLLFAGFLLALILILSVAIGYRKTWKHGAAFGVPLATLILWIVGYFALDLPEGQRAYFVVGILGLFVGTIFGFLEWLLFYEADRDDVFYLDSRGEVIGHLGVPTERRKRALLAGGDELATRRLEPGNGTAYLAKEIHLREGKPDIYVVPPEQSLPNDEATMHTGKVREIHDDLEKDSMALDLLEHSTLGLMKRAYRKGKAHAMILQEDLSATDNLTFGFHKWVREKKEEVSRKVDDVKNADMGTLEDAEELEDLRQNVGDTSDVEDVDGTSSGNAHQNGEPAAPEGGG